MLYFAYGSNMDKDWLRQRGPSATFRYKAKLTRRKLEFTHHSVTNKCGAADATESPSDDVWGAVFEINDSELPALYKAEGYDPLHTQNAYAPDTVTVLRDADENQAVQMKTFFVCDKLSGHQRPSKDYLGHLIKGAKDAGLPDDYQATIATFPTLP